MTNDQSCPLASLGETVFVSKLPPIRPLSFRERYAYQAALERSLVRSSRTRQSLAAVRRLAAVAGVDPLVLIALFRS